MGLKMACQTVSGLSNCRAHVPQLPSQMLQTRMEILAQTPPNSQEDSTFPFEMFSSDGLLCGHTNK